MEDGGGDCLATVHGGKTKSNTSDNVTHDKTGDGHGQTTNVVSGSGDPGQDRFPTDVVTLQPQHSKRQRPATEVDTMLAFNACPAGLDVLLDAGQLVIHKANLRHNIVIRNEAINRMEVIDETRHLLFHVEQDPPPNGEHSFMFHFYDKHKNEVAQIYNPVSSECVCSGASWHWFKNCKFGAIVYAPPGVIVGFIRRSHTVFVQEYEILSSHEDVLLVLRGGPADLEIYTPSYDEIGRLSVHGWRGIMHEIRRSPRDYGLTFPLDLDVRVKAVLLAAVFALDWVCGPKPCSRQIEGTHCNVAEDETGFPR